MTDFRRPYSARDGTGLDPWDHTAVYRTDHAAELAIIAAIDPEETDHGI